MPRNGNNRPGNTVLPSPQRRFSTRPDFTIDPSLPGLTRQSSFFAKWMDARVKPGHDDLHNIEAPHGDA
jgi:hypothetical protein